LIKNWHIVGQEMNKATTHVAAWGNDIGFDDDLRHFMEYATIDVDTKEHDGFGVVAVQPEWKCLGMNADRSPRHTLARGAHRIPDSAGLVTWR